ncbi:MAG: dockerin type I repeat-containing protein, partial [Planctomycetota bacterium]
MIRSTLIFLTLLFGAGVSTAEAQIFEYAAPVLTVPAATSGDTTFVVGFTAEQIEGVLASTSGFSMGVAHDGSVLTANAVDYGPGVIDEEWGEPMFFGTSTLADGWTCGVVYAFLGNWWYEFPVPTVVIEVTYTASAALDLPASTPLTWSDQLGSPPTANVVVVSGASYPTVNVDGQITIAPIEFIRGDMNGDGAVDIADVFTAEEYLFLGGDTPGCLAALDTNNDGAIDIGDIIYELSYLFLGGEPMAAPFPNCGPLPDGSLV